MCIIIARPANTKPLDEAVYKECFRMHKDGAGLAYFNEEGKLVVDKGFMAFKPLYEAIQKLEQYEMMVHFRTASPGMVINPENTHPFIYQGKHHKTKAGKNRFRFVISHNGRLPWNGDKDHSDTYCFIEELLGPLLNRDPWFLDQPQGLVTLELAVTTPTCKNKLVIMRHDAETGENKTYIINKGAGNEAHGCWFSNQTWEVIQHKGWRGNYGGMGFLDWEAEEHAFEKSIRHDEMGWAWSMKYDCWCHDKNKQWCEWLPYRKAPYHVHLIKDQKPKPTGWTRVHVTQFPGNDGKVGELQVSIAFTQNPPIKAGSIIQLEDGKEKVIEVPRDPVVGDDEDPGVPTLEHLSDDEKALLCKEAVSYLKDTGIGKKDLRHLSTAEKIDWLRDAIMEIAPDATKEMNYYDLDMFMIATIKDGKFDEFIAKNMSTAEPSDSEKIGNN